MWAEIKRLKPIERQPDGNLPRLTPQQAIIVRKAVRQCCNYAEGECLLLDDGEGQVCPQSISSTLNCRYFRNAVLPANPKLEKEIFGIRANRRCKICGSYFVGGSGSANIAPTVLPLYIANRKLIRPKAAVERRQITTKKSLQCKHFFLITKDECMFSR